MVRLGHKNFDWGMLWTEYELQGLVSKTSEVATRLPITGAAAPNKTLPWLVREFRSRGQHGKGLNTVACHFTNQQQGLAQQGI